MDYVERSKQTFQSRAVNAAIYLQAFALRDGQRQANIRVIAATVTVRAC